MRLFDTWAGVVAAYALGIALFVYSIWLGARRRRAVKRGLGFDVRRMGVGMIEAGLVIGGFCLFLGAVPPGIQWSNVAGAALLGGAAGALVMKWATAKWDAALRESETLPPHVVTWWESHWVILAIMIALLLFSLLFPAAVASIADAIGSFGATSGYLVAGFFLASGLLITFWAKRRAR